MKILRVHKFSVCQITRQTEIELRFDENGTEHFYKNDFETPAKALAYICVLAKEKFIKALNGYVFHKKHIYEGKLMAEKVESCRVFAKDFCNCQIFALVRKFLSNFHRFAEILPHPENPSYRSSCENLESLRECAFHFMNLKINVN